MYVLNETLDIKNYVDNLVDHIISVVVASVDPLSIVLGGSFGRGEATIEFNDGKINILSDFEVGVICKDPRKRRTFSEISDRIKKEKGVEVSFFWISPKRLKFMKPNSLCFFSYPLTIFMYELIFGSKTIYGEKIIESLRQGFDCELPDIRIWEGLQMVLNRICELCYHLFLFKRMEVQNQKELEFWIEKCFVSIGDYFLIDRGVYNYSYYERMARFRHYFQGQEYNSFSLSEINRIEIAYKKKMSLKYNEPKVESLSDKLTLLYVCFEKLLKYHLVKNFKTKDPEINSFVKILFKNKKSFSNYKIYWFGKANFPIYENLIHFIRLLRTPFEIGIFKTLCGRPIHMYVYSLIPLCFKSLLFDKFSYSEIKSITEKYDVFNILKSDNNFEQRIIKLWFILCYGKKEVLYLD